MANKIELRRPEMAIPMFILTVISWLWLIGAYIETRDITEPIVFWNIYRYSYIDANSYQLFIPPVVILTIISICCLKVTKENSLIYKVNK